MSTQNYGPILTKFNKIEVQDSAWLWPGRIPLGAITTLIGFGGEGKSFLACSVACAVSRGGTFPDGSPAPQGDVVVMAGEDLPANLRQRYEANGADLEKITLLEGQRIYTKNGPADVNLTLRDINQIRDAVDQTQNVKLLIVDPVGDFIPGINSDKDNEVRALLNPLAQLAKDRGLAVLLICHRKKGAGDRADNAALGSVAFTSKARAVHHVILDPYDTAHPSERRRLFLPGKLNDKRQRPGLAFKIISQNDSEESAGIVQWESQPIADTPDAVMTYASAKAKAERAADPHALRDAELWLREALKDGARFTRDLTAEARAEGIAPRTLRRAKQTLGVVHRKVPRNGAFIWEFPADLAPTLPVAATAGQFRPHEASLANSATSTERENAGQLASSPPTSKEEEEVDYSDPFPFLSRRRRAQQKPPEAA